MSFLSVDVLPLVLPNDRFEELPEPPIGQWTTTSSGRREAAWPPSGRFEDFERFLMLRVHFCSPTHWCQLTEQL